MGMHELDYPNLLCLVTEEGGNSLGTYTLEPIFAIILYVINDLDPLLYL
jgi:hypothetical protein